MTPTQINTEHNKRLTEILERLERKYNALQDGLTKSVLAEVLSSLRFDDDRIKNTSSLAKALTAANSVFKSLTEKSRGNLISIWEDFAQIQELDTEYIAAVSQQRKSKIEDIMDKVAKRIDSNFGIKNTNGVYSILQGGNFYEIAALSKQTASINSAVSSAVGAGLTIDGLSGLVNNSGAGVQRDFRYYLLQQSRLKLKAVSDEAGLREWYRFVGPVLNSSRCWCAGGNETKGRGKNKRVTKTHTRKKGKVFTLEEIQDWKNQQWQGKGSNLNYDPFRDVGRHGCVDKLFPVGRAAAKRARPELF